MKPIYLDCNATSPIEPEVLEVVQFYLKEEFGNAGSRTHEMGHKASKAVNDARRKISEVLEAELNDVIFTSGATESNNLAILGLKWHGEQKNKRHIITTAVEHKATLEPLEVLSQEGFEIQKLKVELIGFKKLTKIWERILIS